MYMYAADNMTLDMVSSELTTMMTNVTELNTTRYVIADVQQSVSQLYQSFTDVC